MRVSVCVLRLNGVMVLARLRSRPSRMPAPKANKAPNAPIGGLTAVAEAGARRAEVAEQPDAVRTGVHFVDLDEDQHVDVYKKCNLNFLFCYVKIVDGHLGKYLLII